MASFGTSTYGSKTYGSVDILTETAVHTCDNPHDIYSFLIDSVRNQDKDAGNLLIWRWLRQAQHRFDEMQCRIRDLMKLFDPETADAKALPYIRWMVGLADSVGLPWADLTEDEIRRLISIWPLVNGLRGTDLGVHEFLRRLLYKAPMITNYFDWRAILDEVEIGEARVEGADLWMIEAAGKPAAAAPDQVVSFGTFLEMEATSILGDGPTADRILRVEYLPTGDVEIRRAFARGGVPWVNTLGIFGQSAPPSTNTADYRLRVDPDEFVSDISIEDPALEVNRNLVEKAVQLMRPTSERYNIRYVDFLDQFTDVILRWDTTSGTSVYSADGQVVLEDAGDDTELFVNINEADDWTVYQAFIQFKLRDPSGWGELRFYRTDEDNFLAARIDPATEEIMLDEVVAGVRTTLDSVTLPAWHPDVFYTLRATTTTTSTPGEHNVKIYLDGELFIDFAQSTFTSGGVALATEDGQRLTAKFAEVYEHPLQLTRLGP